MILGLLPDYMSITKFFVLFVRSLSETVYLVVCVEFIPLIEVGKSRVKQKS